MQAPPLPSNEEERLQELYRLNILDTEAEERFDRITRLAQRMFNVPIALVSLVDKDRQWFKSKQGIEAAETPRAISFCGHAILDDEIMIVNNATEDKRFMDNPLVIDNPNIRFYLGCPLKIKSNFSIGTLCLIDKIPRKFTDEDLELIRDLANMVQSDLEVLQRSTTDELTSLSNRRGFLTIAHHIFKLCNRIPTPLTLLFFDLNKFKQINDTYGHAEGDEVLKIFAKALLNNFRESDIVARLGGDEFCVLCSGKKQDINKAIGRLTQTLTQQTQRQQTIEFSVGSIEYDSNKHASFEELLNEADQMMYKNKKIAKDGLNYRGKSNEKN
jgi:diguanylate cyclase (GGDEF)-like protein